MSSLWDFFSHEAGQRRTAWRDDKLGSLGNALMYFVPPNSRPRVRAAGELASMLNPVNDMGQSMADARDGDYVGSLTNAAAALAPAAAGKIAKAYNPRMVDDAAQWLEDALMGLSVSPTRAGLDDAGRAFLADESGNVPFAEPKLTPAQTEAQNVLDLLSQGRANEVTDDMLAAADDYYLFQNYDLPMDEASRMARAEGMGFDTETPLYHGSRTTRDLVRSGGFDDARLGSYTGALSAEMGHFTSDNPALSSSYADATYSQLADEYSSVFSSRRTPETLSDLRDVFEFETANTVVARPYEDGFEWSITERDEMFGDEVENVSDNFFDTPDEAIKDAERYVAEELEKYDQRISEAYRARDRGIERLSDGSGMLPVFGRSENMHFDDFGGAGYGDKSFSDAIYEGVNYYDADAVTLENVADSYSGGDLTGDVSIFPKANQIRSRFARFDPRLKHLSNLSAAAAGIGILGPLLSQEQGQ